MYAQANDVLLPHVLRTRRAVGTTPVETYRTSTDGYDTLYLKSDGTSTTVRDVVKGGGSVTSAARPTDGIFYVSDRVASLTPRGNETSAPVECALSSPCKAYLTEYHVDNGGSAPNVVPGADPCTGTPGNTGLVCKTIGPAYDGTTGADAKRSESHYTYDTFGARRTYRTPKAVADNTDRTFVYDYYLDSERDLSGNVSAGGWLKAITDPTGTAERPNFVYFAYDRAGNLARTWDRTATSGSKVATFDRSTNGAYSETLRKALPGDDSNGLNAPWRPVAHVRDATGGVTSTCTDDHGNPTLSRPARGTVSAPLADCTAELASPKPFDTLFNTTNNGVAAPDDRPLSILSPEGAQRNSGKPDAPIRSTYNAFGELVSSVDPDGRVRTVTYDNAGRAITTSWTRDVYPNTLAPSVGDCAPGRRTTAADAPLPADRILCQTTSQYDGMDHAISLYDATGATSTTTFNVFGELTDTYTPRNDGRVTQLRTSVLRNADGAITSMCPPREFVEGGAVTCTPTAKFGTHRVVDAAGRTTSMTSYRQKAGDPLTTASFDALVSRFRYDADGNTVGTSDARANADGSTPSYEATAGFDLAGRRTSTTVPRDAGASVVTTYGYDPSGNVTSVEVPTGTETHRTTYSYDASHRLVLTVSGATSTAAATAPTSADGGSNVRQKRMYDPDGHLVALIEGRGLTGGETVDASYMTRYDYDREGRLTATYTPRYSNAVPATEQDAQTAHCTTAVDPAAITTGPLPAIPDYPADVAVCVSRLVRNPSGTVLHYIEPTQQRYDLFYTDDDLLKSQTTNVPGPSTNPYEVTTAYFRYDGAGRIVSATDPLGAVTANTYNADGTLASVTHPTRTEGTDSVNHVTRYEYNAAGQRTKVTDVGMRAPSGQSAVAARSVATTTSYYADGSVYATANGAGDETAYRYDPNGNVAAVYAPAAQYSLAHPSAPDETNGGTPTTYAYSRDNLVTRVLAPVSPDGASRRLTEYTYDLAGRKTAQTAADATATGAVVGTPISETFQYYPNGLLRADVGAGNAQITYTYDAAGHQTSVTDSTSGHVVTADPVTGYYLDGLPRAISDGGPSQSGVTTTYSYDGSGNIAARRLTPAAGGGGTVTRYTYSMAGFLVELNDSSLGSAAAVTWKYDHAGRATSETAANGVVTTRVIAPDGTLTSQKLTARRSDSTVGTVATWAYTYDELRRATTQTFTGTAAGSDASNPNAGTQTVTYDSAGRIGTFQDGSAPAVTVGYDHDGNRTRFGTQEAKYNADDSIRTTSDTAHPAWGTRQNTYDPAGGLLDDGCTRTTYDAYGRRAGVTGYGSSSAGCAGAFTTTYTYDGLDRQRTSRSTAATNRATAHATTTFHYDGLGDTVVDEQVAPSAGIAVHYALDAAGRQKALSTANGHEFLAEDGQSDVTATTDGTGKLACTLRYDPYGTPLRPGAQSAGTPCATGTTYTDIFYKRGRRDATTGDYQFGGRTYSPERGGFTTPDTFRQGPPAATAALGVDPLTRNTYNFVNGDPINLSDPSGHAQADLDGAYMPWRDIQRLLRQIQRARELGIPLDLDGRNRPLHGKNSLLDAIVEWRMTSACNGHCEVGPPWWKTALKAAANVPSGLVNGAVDSVVAVVNTPATVLDGYVNLYRLWDKGGDMRPSDLSKTRKLHVGNVPAPFNDPASRQAYDIASLTGQVAFFVGTMKAPLTKLKVIKPERVPPMPAGAAAAPVPAGATAAEAHIAASPRFIANSAGGILDTARVTVPEAKLGYLLENPSKAGVFSKSMGFDKAGLDAASRRHLIDNFASAMESGPMFNGQGVQIGTKFTVTGPLTGPSGATWNIRSVWGVDLDGTIRLITATP